MTEGVGHLISLSRQFPAPRDIKDIKLLEMKGPLEN